jgi:hypothetical protein
VVRHRHELYGMCAKERGIAGGPCPNIASASAPVALRRR